MGHGHVAFVHFKVAEVHRIRCLVAVFGMGATLIVEHEMLSDAGSRIADGIVGVHIDFLVLDPLPGPLDENVVSPAALAVHADLDVVILERLGKLSAGELAALVGVEDLECAVAGKGFLQRQGSDLHSSRVECILQTPFR